MDINVDYEIAKRWRGKKITLPPYRKDRAHHAEVSNAEVNLNIPESGRYLIVQPMTPEDESNSDDSTTTYQLLIYLNGEKKKIDDEYLENVIDTFSLDRRLERFFKKV